MGLVEQHNISDAHAEILWARLTEHAAIPGGSCAAGCDGLCWERASARGTLMIAGRYSAGPPLRAEVRQSVER